MPNYANTQLYELIEHDEEGTAHVYRGHTTQPLHQRLAGHRSNFKLFKKGKRDFCSSFEVLKYGPARIELVRVVSCLNKKEANREEGKFIRELPTCVNIFKNYETKKKYYEANAETIKAKAKKYYEANKETLNTYSKEYREANKETIKAYKKEYREANKEAISAYNKEYCEANKEFVNAFKKKYYDANREALNAYQAEKVTCECGAVVRRNSIQRHRNRMTHIRKLIHC